MGAVAADIIDADPGDGASAFFPTGSKHVRAVRFLWFPP